MEQPPADKPLPIAEVVRQHGLRLTPQRQAILEVLRASRVHPDATWVYQQVRRKLPHISLGTVYRNLAILAEMGLIQEITLGDQAIHWDGQPAPHTHVVCSACRQIVDVELLTLPTALQEQAQRLSGFAILGYRLLFTGLCASCAARRGQAHTPPGA